MQSFCMIVIWCTFKIVYLDIVSSYGKVTWIILTLPQEMSTYFGQNILSNTQKANIVTRIKLDMKDALL